MLRDKWSRYVHDGLTWNGFAVFNSGVAFRLRPGLWATAFDCGADFTDDIEALKSIAHTRGATLYEASIEGIERRVPLLAMSADELARRVEWVIGRRVLAIGSLTAEKPEAAKSAPKAHGEQIPNWPCQVRTDALAKAGVEDDLSSSRTRFPPKRRSV
jgi:hypothetical protein